MVRKTKYVNLEGFNLGDGFRVTEDAAERDSDLREGAVGTVDAVMRDTADEPGVYRLRIEWPDGSKSLVTEAVIAWAERVRR